MEKDLPFELHREILIQWALEQLVEIIVEQASATIKLNSWILELELEIRKLKASRDLDSKTSSKPPSGDILKNLKKNLRSRMVKAKLQNGSREDNQGIQEKLVKDLVK